MFYKIDDIHPYLDFKYNYSYTLLNNNVECFPSVGHLEYVLFI